MKEDFYISLLYKKLDKSIGSEEEKQLSHWISASDDNRLIAKELEYAWKESAALASRPNVDLDAAFAELESKIAEAEPAVIKPIKTNTFQRNWLKIAAAITFLLAAFLLGKDYLTPEPSPVYAEVQTGEEMKSVTLPDNSIIQLNKNSKISYPEKFAGEERRVKLEGEGFFDVTHNANQPFIIETANETVRVLGTSFRVRSYDKEAQSLVQVATGKVSFRSNTSQKELVLTKNQKGILNKAADKLELIQSSNPNEMAWGTKILDFKQASLKQAFEELETYYQVSFEIQNPEVYSCTFTSKFEQEEIDAVFEAMTTTLGIQFKEKAQNTYQVIGGSCK